MQKWQIFNLLLPLPRLGAYNKITSQFHVQERSLLCDMTCLILFTPRLVEFFNEEILHQIRLLLTTL